MRKAGVMLKDAGGLPPRRDEPQPDAITRMRNRYEAAIPSSADRPYLPAFTRDARIDATAWSRFELSRKARYHRRNNWLMKRLQSVDVKYTVGPHGMQVNSQSSDPEWNKRFDEAYQDWCETPFRDSTLPMSQGHQLFRKEMHIDGEAFLNCTFLKVRGERAMPAIEIVESHRVSSPGVEYDYPAEFASGAGIETSDGVEYSRTADGELIGRPDGYWVRLGIVGDKWVLRPVFNPHRPMDGGMIHVSDPDRVGMARVVSEYAPTLNEISDLFLMSMLEIDRAKANGQYAGFMETWSGELPPGMGGRFGGGSLPSTSLPVPGTENDEALRKRLNEYSKTIQAKIQALKPGEKMNWVDNKSPSAATQWLWQFMIERVAVSRDIPMILVLPDSLQGTVSRAVLDDAQISFNLQFGINKRAAIQMRNFFASWAIFNVPGLTNPPPDWKKCHVVPPPSINVDFGRNMQAMLAGIDAGVYDYETIVGRDGSTFEHRAERKARQVAKAKQIAKQISAETGEEVKPEEILGNLADVAAKMAPETEEDEDTTPANSNPRKRETAPVE